MSTAHMSTEIREGMAPTAPPTAAEGPRPRVAIADPAPLGLAAFAMTMCTYSVFNANILPASASAAVLGMALFYGGAVMLVAAMWEMVRGSTFGAAAFGSLGAFWLVYWYFTTSVVTTLPPGQVHRVVGMFMLGWAIFAAYMTIGSLRTNGPVAVMFVLLTVTFVFLSIGAFGQTTWPVRTAGWLGLAAGVLAWYSSFAGVTNSTFKRTVVPVWPLS